MKTNLMHFLVFLAIFYLAYYIDSLQVENYDQLEIIESQKKLINAQSSYIKEINRLLGIDPNIYYIQPEIKEADSPLHRGPT